MISFDLPSQDKAKIPFTTNINLVITDLLRTIVYYTFTPLFYIKPWDDSIISP